MKSTRGRVFAGGALGGHGWDWGGCGRADGLVKAPEATEGGQEVHERAGGWHLGRVARLTAVVYTLSTAKASEGMDKTWSGMDQGRWRVARGGSVLVRGVCWRAGLVDAVCGWRSVERGLIEPGRRGERIGGLGQCDGGLGRVAAGSAGRVGQEVASGRSGSPWLV